MLPRLALRAGLVMSVGISRRRYFLVITTTCALRKDGLLLPFLKINCLLLPDTYFYLLIARSSSVASIISFCASVVSLRSHPF